MTFIEELIFFDELIGDDFKAQPPNDQRSCPVPQGCYCSKQESKKTGEPEPDGTAGQPPIEFWSLSLKQFQYLIKTSVTNMYDSDFHACSLFDGLVSL